MNRRQLFTRLSAIALSPLVKWLPKDERHPLLDAGVITISTAGAHVTYGDNGIATITFKPVPQEEA